MNGSVKRRAGMALVAACLGTACATSVSGISGLHGERPPGVPAARGRPVQVAFSVAHLAQQHGYDAVPKHRAALVADFDEIFRDAMSELPGVSAYTLTTETAPRSGVEVVTRPARSTDRDYLVRLVFLSESSFAADTLWALVAVGTATLVPAPFASTYSVEMSLHDAGGRRLRTYTRQARITSWLQGGLLLAFPFRPPTGEREKLLSTLLRDLFAQMDSESVLVAGPGGAPSP